MTKQLLKTINDYGDKAKLLPILLLNEIQEEMKELNKRENLNNFQKFLVKDMFSYELPELNFKIRSVLIIASPSPSVQVCFNYDGKHLSYPEPSSYCDYFSSPARIENYLKDFLNSDNFHLALADKLPRKYLAAKSGLARYGRNNICYVQGMGCNINLIPFFTDLECEKEDTYVAKTMDFCESCKQCITHCPTKAIREDRFLIDTDRCLTFMNEAGPDSEFPDWVSPSVHNAIVGCTVCQAVCPQNKKYMNNVIGPIEFSEAETRLLLQGISEEQLPENMKQKLLRLDMMGYLHSLPRNLKVLLDKEK